MSFARSVSSKNSGTSTVIPPLPALPKLPSRLQSKRPSILPTISKKEIKVQENKNDIQSSSISNQNDLEQIVNNLSTIVKQSEKLLTPIKQPQITTTVRRTASLHLTKIELDRKKFSNSIIKSSNSHYNTLEKKDDHQSKLHDSISDRSSEYSTSISSIPRRTSIRSLHNIEKYSGIKCSLPSFTSTIPNTFKGLEKHYTPIKNKQPNISSSFIDNQITPANTNGRDISPWRLRFEKFLKHEEPTPLSPSTESIASTKAKTSSLGKENRTPSFRLPTRRTSKFNLPS
jgi:hypothetical protein